MLSAEPNDRGDQPLVADRGPTVLRIALGSRLRRLREERGVDRDAAGDAIRGSHAKISRLETGRTGFKERDLRDLLTLYGITEASEREEFLELARLANKPGWWHQYNDLLPSWFETYIGLEQAASSIRTYEAQFVPGLFQTECYAHNIIGLGHKDETDRRVAMRLRRQEILTREEPPTVWAVVDEAALRRPVGGRDVLRNQIRHLLEVADLPRVTIQILPYSVGGHAAASGSFSILRFIEAELPDIVYAEQLTSALYLDRRQDLELYLQVMDTLSAQAEPPQRTPEILSQILAEFD